MTTPASMSALHSPLPWHTGKWNSPVGIEASPERPVNRIQMPANAGAWVTGEDAEANTAFIVRAVNSHAQLVAALEAILTNEEHAVSCGARVYQKGSPTWEVYEEARAALAAAKATS